MALSEDQQTRYVNNWDEDWLTDKLQYSTFSTCKKIDDGNDKIRYRHHCDEGVFTVEIHA